MVQEGQKKYQIIDDYLFKANVLTHIAGPSLRIKRKIQ